MMMKTEQEIDKAIRNLETMKTNYFGQSYEDGIREALQWVLGEISDEDFEYAQGE